MTENPYEPPETKEPAESREILGLEWHDFILPGIAMILGVLFAMIMMFS